MVEAGLYHFCGTLAGAVIPELVKAFTSVESRTSMKWVTSAKEGGRSLGILSVFVAGISPATGWVNHGRLMSVAYLFQRAGLSAAAP